MTSDYLKMLEETEKLIGGLKVSLSLFENARGILAVEDNKPECIAKLKRLTKDENKIAVKALKTKYPQVQNASLFMLLPDVQFILPCCRLMRDVL